MAEELQGLLEKIHEESIKKADDEKNMIISSAKSQAAEIVKKAKAEAADIRKKAEQDAAESQQRADAAIKQAVRDSVLELRAELETRLGNTVKNCIGEAMSPEFMGQIIMEMVKRFEPNADNGIQVMLSAKDLEKMEKLFKGSLAGNFKSEPEIFAGHDFGAGLKVGFKGSDVFFDFSDEAVADIICTYAGPRIAALLMQDKTKSE